MGLRVLPVDVVGIIRSCQRDIQFTAHYDEGLVHPLQFGYRVSLYLQVEIAEGPLVPPGGLFCFLKRTFTNQAGNLTGKAGREGDQSLVVLLKEFFIHPRFVIEALKVCLGDELYQVLISRPVLSQQDQVVVVLALGAAARAIAGG